MSDLSETDDKICAILAENPELQKYLSQCDLLKGIVNPQTENWPIVCLAVAAFDMGRDNPSSDTKSFAETLKDVEMKTNKLTSPTRSWQPHHFRHMLSGSVVFALGVMAHVILDEVKYRWPRDVKWGDGSVTHGFQRGYSKISTNAVVIGITDDGTLVWREITNK